MNISATSQWPSSVVEYKKKIKRNIMQLEKKYKSTKNKIKISLLYIMLNTKEKMHRPGFEPTPIQKYIFLTSTLSVHYQNYIFVSSQIKQLDVSVSVYFIIMIEF